MKKSTIDQFVFLANEIINNQRSKGDQGLIGLTKNITLYARADVKDPNALDMSVIFSHHDTRVEFADYSQMFSFKLMDDITAKAIVNTCWVEWVNFKK